ncbi:MULTISPECIES: phenylalanine--tRNA ligase subunit alpha [Allobacillus]|uniref:Phenylalanine--tRNA ligase alpha subunit n=1 Tax=Allobacillus halotolerans TaxID=570278 RepID=A0ABS6GM62_9BACI|nr:MULTISPECIES: phenylalanine--tRNA ligase subunit alpha [Allobacillus]MBU6080173.1 phenylalanine--tRNA ligase subunit alpha [Allobacillus halotolerans]TSJ68383.1 phenylalanine--tRNA ligase subunit alpha [Allobacillus sp. SKP2-8]
MKERLQSIKQEAITEIEAADTQKSLQDVRVQFLGKKGKITEVLKGMGKLSKEERPVIGQLANEVRDEITASIEEKADLLEKQAIEEQLKEETIDVTLPGRPTHTGGPHILMKTIRDIEDLFIGMGYEVAEGPEVETDYYNFEALNLPKGHPARDMQDSFYITEELLMRTHTSPVQARTLNAHEGRGPVKIICPGKVYRRDTDDATHSHQFTQIEGLYVDEHITMSDLKGTLNVLAKHLFGEDREIRLRPSFFPFTEPSVEMDISCKVCNGDGCSVCKHTGWIEILGAGLVHPNVLEMAGFDSKKYTGFAFGMGPERIAMLKYGIEDIRHFYTNDVRFLKQFHQV